MREHIFKHIISLSDFHQSTLCKTCTSCHVFFPKAVCRSAKIKCFLDTYLKILKKEMPRFKTIKLELPF